MAFADLRFQILVQQTGTSKLLFECPICFSVNNVLEKNQGFVENVEIQGSSREADLCVTCNHGNGK